MIMPEDTYNQRAWKDKRSISWPLNNLLKCETSTGELLAHGSLFEK
jgi:hypothetical protein